MAEKRLSVKLQLNDKDFQNGLRKASSSMKKFGRTMKRTGQTMSRNLTLPIAALGVASVKAFDDQAKAIAQVDAGLISTGHAAGFTSDQLQKMASDLQAKTIFGDEVILKDATAQLLTFTNIAGEQFERTQVAALNLATRLDGDLKSASIQLGKALNDPVANLSALSRSGIQFSSEQKEVIKSLAETNRLADAQTIILDELEKQYGGAAEAAAKAGLGPFEQLKNTLGDVSEEFGKLILENIEPLKTSLTSLAERLRNLTTEQKESIIRFAGIAAVVGPLILIIGQLSTAIGSIIGLIRTLSVVLATNPFTILLTAVVALTAGIGFALVDMNKFLQTAISLGSVGQVTAKVLLKFANTIGVLATPKYVAATTALNALGKEQKELEGDVDDTTSSLEDQLKAIQNITSAGGQTGGGGSASQQAPDSSGSPLYFDPIKPIITSTTKAQPLVAKLFQTLEEGTNQANESALLTSLNFDVMMEKFETGLNNFVNVASQVFTAVDGLIQSIFDKRNQELDNYYQKELNNINNSKMTEEQKANAITDLDEEVFTQRKSIQKKQARADKALAVMSAIISTAAATATALTAGPVAGPILAGIVAGLGQVQIATILATPIPQLAEGGIAFGNSMVNVGEYSGANVNPEVIAPLDKLKGMLGMETLNVVGTISGEDIVLASDRYNTRANRSF